MEPVESIFENAIDDLWNDECGYGYYRPLSGNWHLPDGRIFKVTFQETSVISV